MSDCPVLRRRAPAIEPPVYIWQNSYLRTNRCCFQKKKVGGAQRSKACATSTERQTGDRVAGAVTYRPSKMGQSSPTLNCTCSSRKCSLFVGETCRRGGRTHARPHRGRARQPIARTPRARALVPCAGSRCMPWSGTGPCPSPVHEGGCGGARMSVWSPRRTNKGTVQRGGQAAQLTRSSPCGDPSCSSRPDCASLISGVASLDGSATRAVFALASRRACMPVAHDGMSHQAHGADRRGSKGAGGIAASHLPIIKLADRIIMEI